MLSLLPNLVLVTSIAPNLKIFFSIRLRYIFAHDKMSKNKDLINEKMSTDELSTGIGKLVYDYPIQI